MGGRGSNSHLLTASGVSPGAGQPNDATEYYVSGEGMWINQYLRGRGDFGELSESEKQYLSDLDKATSGTVKDGTLYRSVDASAIFGNLGEGQYQELYEYLRWGAGTFGAGAYADGIRNRVNNIINRTTGKEITEKGFMSTTKDVRIAEEFGGFTGAEHPVVMEIKTAQSTKGVDVSVYDRNVSSAEAQKEVLLGRNQSYKVNNITVKNGSIYVEVKMTGG